MGGAGQGLLRQGGMKVEEVPSHRDLKKVSVTNACHEIDETFHIQIKI
jgi:hypothetical protein